MTLLARLALLAALGAAVLAPLARAARAGAPEAAAANEAGAALFDAGRYDEAAQRFREALAADPGQEAPRRNLAAAIGALGQRELRAGRIDEARALLEEAAGIDPSHHAFPALLAMLHLGRGDLYDARRHAERAVDLAPGDATGLEILGDVDYREGFLDRARRAWEQALAAGGTRSEAVRAKLERLGREAEVERSFEREVSRHFTIQYDGTVSAEVADAVSRLLEEAYDRLWREFGRAPQHDIPVILTSRVLFASITGSAAWVGGAYDGKIRIPVGGLQSAGEAARLAPVLAHELTHAFLRANVPGRLPLWFEEGLAEHLAGVGPDAARAHLGGEGAPFPSLAAVDAALRGGARVETAYAAAALAVGELARRDGAWLLRRVVQLAGEGLPFPEAFRRAAGMELAEFESRWAAAR